MVSPTTLLATDLGECSEALGVDVGNRLLPQSLDVGAGIRDTLGPRVISGSLGAHDDVVRLPAGLGEDGLTLVSGSLAVAPGGVGVQESLLDAVPTLTQLLRDGLQGELPRDGEEDQEIEGADDDPEQVDRQAALDCLVRSEHRSVPDEAVSDGEQVHHELLDR